MKTYFKTIVALTLLISTFATSKAYSKKQDTDPPKVIIVIKP